MILYGKLADIEKDKIYVCAHCTDDGYKIDDFSIFAYINQKFNNGVMICRFQKFGKVEYLPIFLKWADFNHYYKPLNNCE